MNNLPVIRKLLMLIKKKKPLLMLMKIRRLTNVDQEEETATKVDQDNKPIFVGENEGSN